MPTCLSRGCVPPLALLLRLALCASQLALDGRKFGEIVARDGPMGPEPMPWQGSDVDRRLHNGQVRDTYKQGEVEE